MGWVAKAISPTFIFEQACPRVNRVWNGDESLLDAAEDTPECNWVFPPGTTHWLGLPNSGIVRRGYFENQANGCGEICRCRGSNLQTKLEWI